MTRAKARGWRRWLATLTGYVSDARLDALLCGAEVVVHPQPVRGLRPRRARGDDARHAGAGSASHRAAREGGDAAAYFDPSDPDDLVRHPSAVLSNAAWRADLARRGLAHAAGFSWERTAARTAVVYRELL